MKTTFYCLLFSLFPVQTSKNQKQSENKKQKTFSLTKQSLRNSRHEENIYIQIDFYF